MATRVLTTGRTIATTWERLAQTLATWSPMAMLLQLRNFLWPTSASLRERWMRLVWLPFWIGTEIAAPHTGRQARVRGDLGPASRRLVMYLTSIRRRQLVIRYATVIARGIALGLLISAIWAAWAASGGRQINSEALLITTGILVAIGLVFGWRHRPDLRETATMLDNSFALSDRTATAFDHLTIGPNRIQGQPHLAYLQIAEATNTVVMLNKHSALRVRPPVRELVLIAGLALLFLGLYLVRGTGAGLPLAGNSSVPAFVAAKDRLQQQPTIPTPPAEVNKAPSVEDVQKRADQSSATEQDLLKIADALADNPLTAPIADSIKAGDYQKAADQLNAVSSQVSQLSPESRADLADKLDQAADGMTGQHPDLQDATHKAADGLRSDPQQAQSSLSNLSDQISKTGQTVESQQALAKDMRDAREAQASGSSNQGSRPEPGDTKADSSQGNQQIAGQGGDASSGQGQQPDQGQQTNGSGQSDSNKGNTQSQSDQGGSSSDSSSAPPSGQQNGASGQSTGNGPAGQVDPSSGNGSGQTGTGETSGPSQPSQGTTGGQSNNAQTGAGAGSGSEGAGKNQTSSGGDQKPGGSSGTSPDPNVGNGNGGGSGSTGQDNSTTQTHSSITLSRSPDATGMQSGGSASSSSGSGSGAAAGPGSVSQGDVGTAGPDSNRVPKQYREIVEDYFSDKP
jgi:hypothetical protein